MIEKKKTMDGHSAHNTRPHSRALAVDPLSMTQAFKGKTSFNQVVNADNIGMKKSKTIMKHKDGSQKLFKNCSEYLETRLDKKSMHKDID